MEDDDDVLSFLEIQNLPSKKGGKSHHASPKKEMVGNNSKHISNSLKAPTFKKAPEQAGADSLYAPRTTILFSDDDDFLDSGLSTSHLEHQPQKNTYSDGTKPNSSHSPSSHKPKAYTVGIKAEPKDSTRMKKTAPDAASGTLEGLEYDRAYAIRLENRQKAKAKEKEKETEKEHTKKPNKKEPLHHSKATALTGKKRERKESTPSQPTKPPTKKGKRVQVQGKEHFSTICHLFHCLSV